MVRKVKRKHHISFRPGWIYTLKCERFFFRRLHYDTIYKVWVGHQAHEYPEGTQMLLLNMHVEYDDTTYRGMLGQDGVFVWLKVRPYEQCTTIFKVLSRRKIGK